MQDIAASAGDPIGYDSTELKDAFAYCRLFVDVSAVTVEYQERVYATASSEYFRTRITVARAGFVRYDCHQAMKKQQRQQYLKNFLLSLLSVLKNHLLEWQYVKHFYAFLLSVYVTLAVI